MRIIADFHLHSKYSRATSRNLDLAELSKWAKVKGINLLGASDLTHPTWLAELKKNLQPIEGTGLFSYQNLMWMLTTEISTVYYEENKLRKVHHMVHVPNFDIANQLKDLTANYTNPFSDGRPAIKLSSSEFVEQVTNLSSDCFVYPSHVWTSWFGALGEFSGYDSLEECYKDQVKHIHALETGMSSNPAMNWRVSKLDNVSLISNSDSHSAWPWRLGREANVFDLENPDYWKIHETIRSKSKNFLFTIETPPEYGKYHFDGHRNCNFSCDPKISNGSNDCPRCGKKLTIGVLHRVEKLADRPEGFIPKNSIPFKSLVPLSEIIGSILGSSYFAKKTWETYNQLIAKFGSEYYVLLDATIDELRKIVKDQIALAIIKNREGKLRIRPGYDGLYGKIILESGKESSLDKFV